MSTDDGVARLEEVQQALAAYRGVASNPSDDQLLELRRSARAAIDRLDDHPRFDEAHATLDEVGQYIRRNRPHLCFLAEAGTDFAQECPIALGHIRMGFSVGMEIEESYCSICGLDLWQCPHVPGEIYNGEPVVRVISRAKLFEVSIVDRPDFADARITSWAIARSEVENVFGGPLPANMRPVCDRCMQPCPGVESRPDDASLGLGATNA
jgi:hypothetical protein